MGGIADIPRLIRACRALFAITSHRVSGKGLDNLEAGDTILWATGIPDI